MKQYLCQRCEAILTLFFGYSDQMCLSKEVFNSYFKYKIRQALSGIRTLGSYRAYSHRTIFSSDCLERSGRFVEIRLIAATLICWAENTIQSLRPSVATTSGLFNHLIRPEKN